MLYFAISSQNNLMMKGKYKNISKIGLAVMMGLMYWSNLHLAKAQWATVSAGGTDTVGGLTISSSLGEWDVQTLDYPGGQIQMGVQQPYRMPWLQTRLTGSLLYGNAAATPLVGTEVQLRQGAQLLASALTNAGGQFDLGMVDTGQYQLTYQNPTPWRGVNSTDALSVLRHFTNGIQLQGLYRQAADVNARNLINAMEAQTIARRTIRLVNQFAAGDWLYDRSGVGISAQTTPQNSTMVLPITALCYGDVNGSYTPGAPLRTGWMPMEPGGGVVAVGEADEGYEWPIHWVEGGNVGAITLELRVPLGIEVEGVMVGQSRVGSESLYYHQTGDVLRVAWYGLDPWEVEPGGELIRLKVRGVPTASWHYGAESELADGWAQPLSGFRLMMPQAAGGGLEARVLPNPMGDRGRLWCSVPGSGEVSYRLSDAYGRMVWSGAADVVRASVFEVELPVERMQQGAYQLQVIWQGGSGKREYRTIKIVKN